MQTSHRLNPGQGRGPAHGWLRNGSVITSCAVLVACGPATETGAGADPAAKSQAALAVDCSQVGQVQTALDAKKILGIAKDVADIYANTQMGGNPSANIGGAIQLASDLLDLSSPSVDEQFQALRAELECLAQALDWKMEGLEANTQWSAVSGAWMDAQTVGFARGSFYDGSSHDATLGAGGLIMFERYQRESATDGPWKSIITNHQADVLDVNQVFDWRMALPQFARMVAMRIAMIAMMDPQFATDALWNPELDAYRQILQARLQQMTAAVRCDRQDRIGTYLGHITGYSGSDIACADVNTGLSAVQQYVIPDVTSCAVTFNDARVPYTGLDATCFANLPGHATVDSLMDPLRRQVLGQMPIFEVQSLIDTLFRFTHPAADLSVALGRIPVAAAASLCLDVQWGNSASGTPVWIWGCNGSGAQQWSYDREAQTITNTAFAKCLQVRQKVFHLLFADLHFDDNAPRAIAEIGDCISPAPLRQRWTYDPEGGALHNALGTVLDVQWGSLQAATPVWLWDANGGAAQQWLAD